MIPQPLTRRPVSVFDTVNKEEALRGNTDWWKGEARAQRSGESDQAYRNYGNMREAMGLHVKNWDDPAYQKRLADNPLYVMTETGFRGQAPDEERLSRFNQFMFSNPNNPNNPDYIGPRKGWKGSEDYKGTAYQSENVLGFDWQWKRGEDGSTLERVDNPWTPDMRFESDRGVWSQGYILDDRPKPQVDPPPAIRGVDPRGDAPYGGVRKTAERTEQSVQREGRDLTAGGIAKPSKKAAKPPGRVGRGPDPRRIRIPQKARGVKRRGKQTLLGGYA